MTPMSGRQAPCSIREPLPHDGKYEEMSVVSS